MNTVLFYVVMFGVAIYADMFGLLSRPSKKGFNASKYIKISVYKNMLVGF